MTVADIVPDRSGVSSALADPEIAPGDRQEPLFFVTASGGGEEEFEELCGRPLEGGVQVWGLPGIDAESLTSIEQLATKHLDAIRRVQPQGPYRLGGVGSGGLVAYEMAFKLIGEDQVVDFLGLVNSRRPQNHPDSQKTMAGGADVCNAYCPQPLPITVHLFAAHDTAEALSRDWAALAGCKLSTEIIPAGPASVLPTAIVERLAQTMRDGLKAKGSRADTPESKYSALITIQAGNRAEPPVFCVPGAGANVTSLMSLAEMLGEDIAVHGLQPRGMDKMLVPHSTLAAAARAYIRDMREVERRGPYRLLGHSFGGWVVFEMACQLIEMGQRVDGVVLIDTQPPTKRVESHYSGRVDILTQLIRILEQSSERCLDLTRAELETLAYEAQLIRLMASMKAAGLLPQATKLDVIRGLVRVFSVNVNTVYAPTGRFAGEMLLVQARDETVCRDVEDTDELDNDSAAEVWRQYAERVVQAKTPGNHMTMLKKPNVDEIAAHVRAFWGRSMPDAGSPGRR